MAKQISYGLGWKPDIPDWRDERVTFAASAFEALPASNDRLKGLPEIWDQGAIGSCTAHGILRCYLFAAGKAGLKVEALSRLQLYYDERDAEGTLDNDSGAMIRTGIEVLKVKGCGLESFWPYVTSKYTHKPPAESYASGLDHQALKAARVGATINEIKAVLAEGYPVVFGTPLYESVEGQTVRKSGLIPVPRRGEDMVGGHCMAFNGEWDDKRGVFGLDNSWGTRWGIDGIGYLPYEYVDARVVSDCWVLCQVEGVLPVVPPGPVPVPVPPTPVPVPVIGGGVIMIDLDRKHADFPPGWTGTVRKS